MAPDALQMDRTAFDRLKRKDSDDGLQDMITAIDEAEESERSLSERHRRKVDEVATDMTVV
jgi:hypothetical protein